MREAMLLGFGFGVKTGVSASHSGAMRWFWSDSPLQHVATSRVDANASRGLGTHSYYMPCPQPPATSALPFTHSPAPTQGLRHALLPPPTRYRSITLSPVSLLPLPHPVVFPGVPQLTSVPPLSSLMPLVPPASCQSAMKPSKLSPTSTLVHPLPSTIMAPVKPVSPPSLARDSVPATKAPAPSSSSGRIIPAHWHSDYNRRDFSRSAVPGSVFNLKVTY